MHGLRDLAAGKRDTPARRTQAERLAALVQGLAETGDAVAICGDFNVEPGSETLRILAAEGLHDLVIAGGFDGTRIARSAKPGRFADSLLVNDRVLVRRFDLVRRPEVSDHCPLLLKA